MGQTPSIVCVGGGVTGIIAAKLINTHGANIKIIEKEESCGGLWSSVSRTLGNTRLTFDNGLRLAVGTGEAELDQKIFDDLDDVDWVRIKGYPKEGHIFNQVLYSENSCIDARQLGKELLASGLDELLSRVPDPVTKSNLADQLVAEYGPTFTKHIFNPVMKRFTGEDLDRLAPTSHRGIIPRRLIVADHDETLKFLMDRPHENRIAHTTTKDLMSNATKEFLYPKQGGIGRWVQGLIRSLDKNTVKFHTGTNITNITHSDGYVRSLCLETGDSIEVDAVIWTLAPELFYKLLGEKPKYAAPVFMHVLLVHAVFDKPFNTNLHYISNYDPNGVFHRAVIYPNITGHDGQTKYYHLSLEVIVDPRETNIDKLKNAAIAELEQYRIISSQKDLIQIETNLIKNIYPVVLAKNWVPSLELKAHLQTKFTNVAWIGRSGGEGLFLDSIVKEANNSAVNLLNQLNMEI
ncbi:MAG: FAD-dependent oxidoreductase [Pseudomonadota bacterium]|nr:FAD-dependent oxidoreductase [Pseudomonadota bacterium]